MARDYGSMPPANPEEVEQVIPRRSGLRAVVAACGGVDVMGAQPRDELVGQPQLLARAQLAVALARLLSRLAALVDCTQRLGSSVVSRRI